MAENGRQPRVRKPLKEERREIGRRIREARRGAGLTQSALADKLGLRLWHIERFESGLFRDEELDKVAAAVGRPLSWFVEGGPFEPSAAPTQASGEAIRLLFETRLSARRDSSERQAPQRPASAAWHPDELRRWSEMLAKQQASRPGWRRLLTRESDRDLEHALSLLRRAVELQADLTRRTVELEAEVARSRMREDRLGEALSSALHASDALVDEARTEAALVLRKARRRAQRMIAHGARERERAEREIRGLRKVLDEAGAVSRRMAESLQRLEAATSKPDGRAETRAASGRLVEDLLSTREAAPAGREPLV